jgi:adenylate kinase
VTRPTLVVFGRQGAGKGTQCEFLTDHYGAVHISTGDMLREAVEAGTEFGRQAQVFMDAGQLLPDEVMVGVVAERLGAPDVAERGFLLDGFPRTVPQAEALCAMTDVAVAVDIDVPEDEVRTRMEARGRADDTPEAIGERLAAYAAQTVPTIAWFADTGRLVTVDGIGTREEVSARLVAAIDPLLAGS